MCLKESCFPHCWKVSSVVPVFKYAKNYCPVSLLSVVSKVFEKLVNNRIADHLAKCSPFSDIQYGFKSSRSTADCLTVLYDKVVGFLTDLRLIELQLDISKAFGRVWHASFLLKFKSYGVSVEVFGLISSFLSNRWLWKVLVESLRKNIQLILGSSRVYSWSYTFPTIH